MPGKQSGPSPGPYYSVKRDLLQCQKRPVLCMGKRAGIGNLGSEAAWAVRESWWGTVTAAG
jgi:hypothetical protein